MTNVNISDLGITTALETGDKIVVRKSGANYDTAITKQNIAKSLGNTAAIGFVATSDTANKIILTPTNGAELDDYYDQMLITFVSPITSNADVEIKIDGLAYKNIIVNGNSIAVTAGDYIEAYYHAADDEFKQSNNIEATIYTPEFTAVNSTVTGNTLITLTSAAGNHKTAYYNGMLITFVNPANTLAGINVNVDGLGVKALEVRTASGYIIPANTIVTAVYQTDRFICNKSIQGTSLDLYGYVASSSAANQVQLNSVSGITGSNYVTGMRVSFVSPITTNAATKLNLPGMALKNFYKYGSTDNKPLVANNFYEAVYIGDAATGAFYETNATTDTIYTNEYTATAVIAGDNSSTTYTLTSAIGVPKSSYYNAMSILFTSPVDSKGTQIVNVDGLGDKILDDNDIQNEDITAGDAIMAIYDGTKFIKHRFATVEDPIPNPDPTPNPDIIVTVGHGGNFTRVPEAILKIVKDYGSDGGGRKVKIQLLPNFTWNSDNTIYVNQQNLSWITIASDINGNNITEQFMNLSYNSVNPNIEGTFRFTNTSPRNLITLNNTFRQLVLNNLNITNTINNINVTLIKLDPKYPNRGVLNADKIEINNCNITNFKFLIDISPFVNNYTEFTLNYLIFFNSIWTTNQTGTETSQLIFIQYISKTGNTNNVRINSISLINSAFNFNNSNISTPVYNIQTYYQGVGSGFFLFNAVYINTCTFDAIDNISSTQLMLVRLRDTYITIENSIIRAPKINMMSLYIQETRQITITGGDCSNKITRFGGEISVISSSLLTLKKDADGNYTVGNRQVDSSSTVTLVP